MSRVQELAERLIGTCDSIHDEQDGWSMDELLEFDNECFCCECCGWWYETSEAADQDNAGSTMICENCAKENAEESEEE